jgi:hypothetical protein
VNNFLILLFGFVILIVMIAGIIWQRNNEIRWWNKGKCSRCGNPWKDCDVDSQGGRGYSCSCGNGIWISYNIDN